MLNSSGINLLNKAKEIFNTGIWMLVLKAAAAAGLMLYIIFEVDFNKIYSAFQKGNSLLIGAAFLLGFVNLYSQYLKWKLSLTELIKVEDKKKTVFSLFYGFSAGIFTPARAGEYIGRSIPFKDQSLIKITLTSFADKLFTLLVISVTGCAALLIFLNIYYGISGYQLLGGTVITAAAGTAAGNLLFKWGKSTNVIERIGKKNSTAERIISNFSILKEFTKDYSLKMSLFTFLYYACYLIQFALLISAFTGKSEPLNYLYAGVLITFAKTIIPAVTVADLGIREAAAVFFLGEMGESTAAAFNASIFLFLINVLFPALIGFVLLLKRNND